MAVPEEGVLEGGCFALCEYHFVEKVDDTAFELGVVSSADGHRGDAFPHNVLRNVAGNEEGDATADTLPFVEQFVQEDDQERGHDQLAYHQHGGASPDGAHVSVHA